MHHTSHRARRVAAGAALAAVVLAGVAIPAAGASAAPRVAHSTSATSHHAPKITYQPRSKTVAAGKRAVFTVKASGAHVSYRWYSHASGAKWKAVAGATKATLSVEGKASLNGRAYRVVVSNSHGRATSHTVHLTVAVHPRITSQPRSATVVTGKKTTFHVAATGHALSYRWESEAPGRSWTSVHGATRSSYALTTSSSKNGYRYRVVVSNKAGHVTSSSAKLTVVTKPKITKALADEVDVTSGDKVALAVTATGVGLTYQWQYFDDSADGDGEYHAIKGATTSKYAFTATTRTRDDLRVVVSNAAGKTSSETYVVVASTIDDPYGPDAGGLLTNWALGLDTDLKGGPTAVTGNDPTTVTTTFLGAPFGVHADTSDLTFALVLGGTSYPASVTPKSLPYGMGFEDFASSVTINLPSDQVAAGVWAVTDTSGSLPVTQYFSQR